jgi:ABC-2 type transport system ATP-binding protein
MTNCQPASTSPALEAQGIVKQFIRPGQSSPVTALSGVSLTARTGSLTAIIGPDGAGKTTFMRLVCGLLKSDAGSLSVLGMDVASHPQAVQDHIGYMPQEFGLYEDLSVQENLDLYANLHAVPQAVRQERFKKLLDLTGLSPFTKRMAGKLSGGMKQKLGLACTLVSMPPLLLLDEPTVGVDPLSRRELWQILDTLSASGSLTILVATAYLEEAEHCHDVYILHKGHILAQGAPDTLCHYAQGRCYVVRPPENVPPRLIQAALIDETEAVADAVPEGGAVRFSLTPQASLKDLALPGLTVTAVPARLEDSFMSLLRQQEPSLPSHYSRPDMTAAKRVETGRKIIEVRDIVRRFGDFIAVNHTSFSVYEGEIFGLLGPNGAGKSTTFRMLCGLLPVSSGQISVAGVNLRTARAQARAHIGYVAQKFSLYTTLSVEENLRFFGSAYGLRGRRLDQRIEAVIEEFDLSGFRHMPAGSLPGGYKQRLSMAAALLHEPPILFLDEPTSGIDPLARRLFWRQITDLSAKGTTIIVTTHFMEEAEYCDRIMIQDRGQLIAIGTPSAIRKQGGNSPTMNDAFIHIVESGRHHQEVSS